LKPYLIETVAANLTGVPVGDVDENLAFDLYEKLEPLIKRGSPKCIQYINQLRKIPGTEKLINEIEDFNFNNAADLLEILRSESEEV